MTRCRKIAKQTNMWANMSPWRCEMCFAMTTLKSRLLWSPARLCFLLTNSRTVGLSRLEQERSLSCIFRFIIPHSSCHQRCTFKLLRAVWNNQNILAVQWTAVCVSYKLWNCNSFVVLGKGCCLPIESLCFYSVQQYRSAASLIYLCIRGGLLGNSKVNLVLILNALSCSYDSDTLKSIRTR
jgi:hypothetical protein